MVTQQVGYQLLSAHKFNHSTHYIVFHAVSGKVLKMRIWSVSLDGGLLLSSVTALTDMPSQLEETCTSKLSD